MAWQFVEFGVFDGAAPRMARRSVGVDVGVSAQAPNMHIPPAGEGGGSEGSIHVCVSPGARVAVCAHSTRHFVVRDTIGTWTTCHCPWDFQFGSSYGC